MNEGKIIEKLNQHEVQLDKVIKKLLDHDERFERIEQDMFTKADGNKLITAVDEVLVIVKKLDQERIFTNVRLDRHDKQIKRLDDHLGLPPLNTSLA